MKNLKEVITKDGSFSLRSDDLKENFHSFDGALHETQHKFINPSDLQRYKLKGLNVLDICFGLGYNSALLFDKLIKQSSSLIWYGLEIDKRPLRYSLNNKLYDNLCGAKVIKILNLLLLKNKFKDHYFSCDLLWGDARKTILQIPNDIYFDLIYLDGFSPQKCPEIWSYEFLTNVKKKLKPGGYLITYCSAAAIRNSLRSCGLEIFNIKPSSVKNNQWSNGTFAVLDKNKTFISNNFITKLSSMENEHLATKAATPYRDPDGDALSSEILMRRKKEQSLSKLLDTKLWRKKWQLTKHTFNS